MFYIWHIMFVEIATEKENYGIALAQKLTEKKRYVRLVMAPESIRVKQMDRLFLRGRLTAQTYDEAVDKLQDRVEGMGYRLIRPNLKPAPVQPWKDEIWWEYEAEIEEV